jgi:membrane protein YdbS with pleckstrin-like domain
MGRYIDEILQPGESVLYSTNEHWMFFLPAIAAWIVVVLFLVLSRMVAADVLMLVCVALAAVAGLAALYWTVTAWFHRWTTETDVTNMRVVHKTGFIKRRTFEMSLDKVESVDVNQSILGRLMNYGDITIQASARVHKPFPPLPRSRFAMPSRQDRSARKSRHGVPSAAVLPPCQSASIRNRSAADPPHARAAVGITSPR